MVEFALVALLVMTLAAGAFDYGQAWRSGLAVNEAARTGARVGSAGGTSKEADFYALSGLKSSLASSGELENVERVVVFQAGYSDGAIPPGCKIGGGPGCQTFDKTGFLSDWEVGGPAGAINASTGCLIIATSQSWCPTSRNNVQQTSQYYGVWIQLRHKFFFPITGSDILIERTAVMRLEPKLE